MRTGGTRPRGSPVAKAVSAPEVFLARGSTSPSQACRDDLASCVEAGDPDGCFYAALACIEDVIMADELQPDGRLEAFFKHHADLLSSSDTGSCLDAHAQFNDLLQRMLEPRLSRDAPGVTTPVFLAWLQVQPADALVGDVIDVLQAAADPQAFQAHMQAYVQKEQTEDLVVESAPA